jgi:hypothetical protein
MASVLAMISVTADAQVFSKEVTVGELVANPPGTIRRMSPSMPMRSSFVRRRTAAGTRSYSSYFRPQGQEEGHNRLCPGSTQARNGDMIKLTGKFKAKSKRGRYTYDNEIETTGDKVVVTAKGTGP